MAVAFILLPIALLFLKQPVTFVLRQAGRKGAEKAGEQKKGAHDEHAGEEGGFVGFFVALIEGSVDVLEACLMYVANTASFMRLGAYALSHAGLCLVIFALQDAVSGVWGGAVWGMLLVILGNVGVIVLEGLVVAVQTLRLEYYEFFSKFFSGEGKAYKPFDLKSEES
jgi:vacuolar-type H+-ATPase subunit I/STV1